MRRHKSKFQSNLARRVKHLPYGAKKTSFQSYAGEVMITDDYGDRQCVCGGIINKRKARENNKKIILQGLEEYDLCS